MKILILGSTGLLGQALASSLSLKNFQVTGVARKNADINIDITEDESLLNVLKNDDYDVIINTVAIVNLKTCNDDPGLAYKVNSRPASIIANYAKNNGAYFIQISTDHYYSGDKDLLHKETDNIKLLNEYARTKYCGEVYALTSPKALVIRTNIVGFKNSESPTFVEWIVNNLENNTSMNLFNDYYTSSISVKQFSNILYDIILKRPAGILNISSGECFSKEAFIRALADKLDFSLGNSKSYSILKSGLTDRAESLGLDVSKAESIAGYKFPGLDEVIQEICNEYKNK